MTCSSTCEAAACFVVAAALSLVGGPAIAAPSGEDPVAAAALFKHARALVEAGNYAEGCPKFVASLALHASASTALNIAQCHEHDGKLAAAWADYHQALALNRETQGKQRQKGLEQLAQQGIAAIEPRLPRLRVVVEAPPADLEVTLDGTRLPMGALGEALPADPGAHEVRVAAPGHRGETRTLSLTEGATETLTFAALTAEGPPPSDRAPRPRRAPAWAWATGGVGLGLTGVSVYFLVDRIATVDRLQTRCMAVSGGTFCEPGYDFAADNARKNRDLGLFIGLGSAGLIAVTAGIVGVVLAKKSNKAAARKATAMPWFGPSGAGLNIVGRF